jgi:hypothetical protein
MDYFFPFRPTFIAVWANVCEAPLEEGQTPFDRTFYRMNKKKYNLGFKMIVLCLTTIMDYISLQCSHFLLI